MRTLDEIISTLEEYKVYISELEFKLSVLREENEKLKKELNQPQTTMEKEKLINLEQLSHQQMIDIVVTETSQEILVYCTKMLLKKDKTDGIHISRIIAKLIANPNLPEESFRILFEDIKENVGTRTIGGKYEKRLEKLMKNPNFPENLCDEVAKYYIMKYQHKYRIYEFNKFFSLYIAESTPECLRKKLDDVIDSKRKKY